MSQTEETTALALNLDENEQRAFIRYFRDMPEKSAGTVRLFFRSDYYTVHGDDVNIIQKVIKFVEIKYMGKEDKLSYVCINKNNFEKAVRELLLSMNYRVEVYVKATETKNNNWKLTYKGSPGNLQQFEDILFGNVESIINALVFSVKLSKGNVLGISGVNTSECTFVTTEFTDNEFYTELEALLAQYTPKECVIPSGEAPEIINLKDMLERAGVLVVQTSKSDFNGDNIAQDLNCLLHFAPNKQRNALAFPETDQKEAMGSLQAAIKYLNLMGNKQNHNQYSLSSITLNRYVRLDFAALNALDVLKKGEIGSSEKNSIYDVLNECSTRQGKRLLEKWLKQPLRDYNLLKERLDIVEAFVKNSEVQNELQILNNFPDMILLTKKLCSKRASLQDCYIAYQMVGFLPALIKILQKIGGGSMNSLLINPLNDISTDLEKYRLMIQETIDLANADNGEFFIKPSFNEDLRDLAKQKDAIEEKIHKVHQNVCNDLEFDSKTLKIESNDQFGFHFRITTKKEVGLRKNKNYIIINAIKGGIRFTNSKMEDLNSKYIDIKEIYEKQQQNVVKEILEVASEYAGPMRNMNNTIAVVDVLLAFAKAAVNAPVQYIRPIILEEGSGILNLKKARHPMLERQVDVNFIANDVEFTRGETTLYIITGPNMGGKSTYMRTVGVNVLLAHIGSFVAAEEAKISMVDGIYARIGADDSEEKGLSTFMMEMIETCAIIKSATANSLVVIDELGRGTSTHDGCGIAWSIAHHLAKEIKAFTLFATHFQEITMLEEQIPTVNNLHVAAVITEKVISPLYVVKEGVCDKSYGIQCARAADFPEDVINFASQFQKKLEDAEGLKYIKKFDYSVKRKLIEDGSKVISKILEDCKQIDVDTISDEDLMEIINKIKADISKEDNLYLKSLIE